jgi:cellulose synthase (UDP-forming)
VIKEIPMPAPMFSDESLGPVQINTGDAHMLWLQQHKPVLRRDRGGFVLGAMALIGISVLLCYFIMRNLALFAPGYSATDRIASVFLLLSEIYTAIQGLGYYISVSQAVRVPNVARHTRLARLDVPRVAIYIATYNEPGDVIEETVNAVTLLDYPNKQIYLNCDHQSAEQAELVATIARRHQVNFIHRSPNTGFKAGGINAFLQRLGRDLPAADLLCIFDADSIPTPTFLREMIPYFLDEPRLAFVQAPQFYGNTAASQVAAAAGQQQTTFAHFISEGKQQAQAMFFCGTNVVFRVAALRDIGGLRTDSITEDFATSLLLHRRGWRSQYCNAAYVTGIGPTTLRAYWTQQSRWALGNLESFLAAIPQIFCWRGFRFTQRWEYFLSGSYYFVGLNTIITLITPTLYLLLNVRPLILSPLVYIVAFLPHVLLANWFFFATMGKRGYRPRSLFLAQCLSFITFPVYAGAALAALLHRKRGFVVTPKGAGDVLPWRALLPHIVLGALLLGAIVVGSVRFFMEKNLALIVNILWCAYHLALLSTIMIFNQPEHEITAQGLLATE